MDRGNLATQGEIARILVEFLEVSITSVVFLRGIYPPEAFERRRYMNIAVQRARNPQLRNYIHSAVAGLYHFIQKCIVQVIVLHYMRRNRGEVGWIKQVQFKPRTTFG
ncbi:hypothetical protein AMTR_s00060p00057310 [Amborella trichopoda]|uniref:HORMA domain-containing protein n=1 Tax=Amborella trichopoda TaxID=13333 RepID=W1NKR2_AMBTC|nr:hypothetical protein AMTR_s00060p00057310 [Amborella trichopoda]